jgi:hypothetical protein
MMMKDRPDFLVIGAMKSATTTLHEQLARQPAFWMSHPKEPNFFSDDEIYARGWEWYGRLFHGASEGSLRGESSTHYTKLPTYPRTLERMSRDLPELRLIYVMRHPIDRLISHYVHERTVGKMSVGIGEAITRHAELVEYGQYARQLGRFVEVYGFENILPVFFDRLVTHPQTELERIGRFLGCGVSGLHWDHALEPQNRGSDRLRPSAVREVLLQAPVLTTLRQRMIPRRLSRACRSFWRSSERPPELPRDQERRLQEMFAVDLEQLGSWLGIRLDCDNFHSVTTSSQLEWVDGRMTHDGSSDDRIGMTPHRGRRPTNPTIGR